jgi:hypothetical protein
MSFWNLSDLLPFLDKRFARIDAPATVVTGNTYTIKDTDHGRRIRFTSATSVVVTIPNSLPATFECTWEQYGAGGLSFVAGSGGTLRSRGSVYATAGRYSVGGVSRTDEDEFLLYGDIAA